MYENRRLHDHGLWADRRGLHDTLAVTTAVSTPYEALDGGEQIFTATIAVFGVSIFIAISADIGGAPADGRFAISSRRRRAKGLVCAMDSDDTKAALELFFKGPATTHPEGFNDEVLQVYVDAFSPKGAVTPPHEYYRNIDRNRELMAYPDRDRIEVPCLMISAANDPVLHPGLTKDMEARVPNLTKVVIEDCGHWTQQEQPDATTEHMLAYLQTLRPWV